MSFINRFQFIAIVICFVAASPNYAIIYGGVTLADPNNQTWVTFLKDAHLDIADGLETLKQMDAIIELLAEKEPAQNEPPIFDAVVVEDINSYAGEDPKILQYFNQAQEEEEKKYSAESEEENPEENPEEEVLVPSFPQYARRRDVFVKLGNKGEYKQAVAASPMFHLYQRGKQTKTPIINAETRYKTLISSTSPLISCEQVWQDWFDQVKQIEEFAQAEKNPVFKIFYEMTAKDFDKKTLHFWGGKGCSFSQSKKSIMQEKDLDLLQRFTPIEGRLFDGHALHAIRTFMQQGMKHILVIAGAEHCENLIDLFKAAQWNTVLEVDKKDNYKEKEDDVNDKLFIDIQPLSITDYGKKLQDKINASKQPGLAQRFKSMLPFGK